MSSPTRSLDIKKFERCSPARKEVESFTLYLHQLLEGVITGTQFGHSKSSGDAQGRQENVVIVILGVCQVLIEGGGKSRVGLGQFPDPAVGGLWDLLFLAILVSGLLVWRAVNAHGIHRDVPGLRYADVIHRVSITDHTTPGTNE